MSEQLFDLIKQFGGEGAIASMAAKVGLSPEQTQSAMAALMPAIAGGMAHAATTDNADAVNAAATSATTIDPTSAAGVEHGHSILGSLFGDSGLTTEVANKAAAATGIDASKIAGLMPMLATLAGGALASHADGAQGTAPAAPGGGIGGMLGSMLGRFGGGTAGTAAPGGAVGSLLGMLDANKDGSAVDDIMGMIGKLRH